MKENTENYNIEEISKKWMEFTNKYCNKSIIINDILRNILSRYNSSKRHYHNLNHIDKMQGSAEKLKNSVTNFDRVFFAIWFHDIVYNPLKNNNEEESAKFAKSQLKKINYPDFEIVAEMIVRTKNHFFHAENESPELQLLLDCDLETMGSKPEIYLINTLNIRKEYNFYPDIIFNKGRTAVLKKFLECDSIYRTEYFKEKYENQARINIADELKTIDNG